MALQITRPGERVKAGPVVVLVYGEPGTGKTSLAYTARRPLVLDFDRGAHRSQQQTLGTTVQVDTWYDVRELVERPGALDDFDTLVVDTIGACLETMSAAIIANNTKMSNGRGGLSQNGYGALASDWRAFLANLRALGKRLLIVSHHKEVGNAADDDASKIRPAIVGSSYATIMATADFVGFMHVENGRRVLGFDNRNRLGYFAKDSAGLGTVELPDYGKHSEFGADLFDAMQSAFDAVNKEHDEIVASVNAWREVFDGYSELDDYNNGAAELAKVETEAVRKQAGAALMKSADAAGFVYDKKAKAFVPKPTAERGKQ